MYYMSSFYIIFNMRGNIKNAIFFYICNTVTSNMINPSFQSSAPLLPNSSPQTY